MKRCASCGASNPESAAWCSLCLARFDQGMSSAAPAPDANADSIGPGHDNASEISSTPTVVVEPTAAGISLPTLEHTVESAPQSEENSIALSGPGRQGGSQPPPAASSAIAIVPREERAITVGRPAPGSSSGAIFDRPGSPEAALQQPAPLARPVVSGVSARGLLMTFERDPAGRLVQRCRLCQAINPLEANECVVCGADFLAALRKQEVEKNVTPQTALIWGLIPGGGYIPLGKVARFLGHLSLTLWLLLLSFLLFLLSPHALFPFRLGFAVMAAAVWAASAIDANRLAGGQEETLLTGRRPVIIFAASLALIFVMGFVLAWSALRKSPDLGSGEAYGLPAITMSLEESLE